MQFHSQHPQYEYLRRKWVDKHKSAAEKFWRKHGDVARHLVAGGVAGTMLLSLPGVALLPAGQAIAQATEGITKQTDKNALLVAALKPVVPDQPQVLTPDQESQISQVLTNKLGVVAKPEVNGIRLNRTYGLIGGEQHLYRYPGDNIYQHADNASDWAMYGDAGVAPGLGAWGYFAPSQSQMTEQDKQREKWYIAVQTFLAPGYAENVKQYHDFFKYRKMIVVNPQTGQAVVADIADAGPSDWTGKQLGGSPEVMQALGLGSGPRKGGVLYFFVDDPNNQIPLGPIQMKGEES